MAMRKLGLLAFLNLLTLSGFSQNAATGDLRILVKDYRNDTIANATISARDPVNAVERSAAVSGAGEYVILALPPGSYIVAISAPGFAKSTVNGVTINVGQMVELPITLFLAGAHETITVSSAVELVEKQRTASTNTIDQRRIDNLPINGRNYINFALTDSRIARDDAPSIGAAPTSGLNISGQRARANLVNVDGASAVDDSVNGIRSTVSQDAVQEFQIITSSYLPEYGRASGGVVNIITHSGTNKMHGKLFGYLRNRNFQAVNPFSTVSNPAYTRVQSGIALGGPIEKNKTFYFFSYEGTWRQETGFSSIGNNNFGLIPFDASGFLGLQNGSYVIDVTQQQAQFLSAAPPSTPGGLQYVILLGRSSGMALNGLWPGPLALDGGFSGFPTSCQAPPCFVPRSFVPLKSIIGNFPITERTGLYSLRLDHNFSTTNTIMLRGGVSPSDISGIQVEAQGPQNLGQNSYSRTSTQDYHDWSIAGQDQWIIGSRKVNEFLFQYARRGLLYGFSRGTGGSNVGVNIPGFAFFGREPFSFVNRIEQRYELTDNFSWTKGLHNIKFGIDSNFLPITADFTVNFGGVYNFGQQSLFPAPFPTLSPIQAYGAGIPSNFVQGVGNPHGRFSNTTAAVFLQDSWKINSNVTANYGIRYDVEFTPRFVASTILAKQAQDFLGIMEGIPRDFDNVAPRIGLAWDPKGDGKTVVRASYGLFYGHPLLALAFVSDVADGSKAPQVLLFPGVPCTSSSTPSPLNMNAPNAFQGLISTPSCTPPGFTQAVNYISDQQRFNPAPNAPSVFVGQQYLQGSGVPLANQPFGFPVANNFQYGYSNQTNLALERDLGHDLAITLEYNFNGGRRNNRPIPTNSVDNGALMANWRAALTDDAHSGASALGPLGVGALSASSGGTPCQLNPSGTPWVSAALVSFFRPSGLNPSLANTLIDAGAGICVQESLRILQANSLNTKCNPLITGLTACIPFSDMPANFANGSSVYHGFTAHLRKRFGRQYEFLASYTWSHAIDDSTDLQSQLGPQDAYTLAGERANSLFDQRHRFVFSAVYETGRTIGNRFVRRFFSGWTIAPIVEAVSGRPFNIITGSDTNFDFSTSRDRPQVVLGSSIPDQCGNVPSASKFSPSGFLRPPCYLDNPPTLDGNLRRDAGTKPMDLFTDIRIAKSISLEQRVTLEGVVDAFNFINRFNVLDVNPLWNSDQKPVSAFDARQLQFALKLSW
jgi:hypothetical protein